VIKQGRVVLGGARFEVRSLAGGNSAPSSSLVIWAEEIELAPAWLTRPAGPLIAAAGRAGLVRALRIMARELERGEP
jgi:hypothetical protein